MTLLQELVDKFAQLEPAEFLALEKEFKNQTPYSIWTPNAGPQTLGFHCEADELFYGGQAGGGKSDLVLGLAFTVHETSLILREYSKDARALALRAQKIVGTSKGFNGQLLEFRYKDKVIEFGGCRNDQEMERFKGRPHDLICFDEISDFTENTYRFISAWNRSAKVGQRSRVLATGNPPTKPEGLWVVKYWGAWLDPTHPNPAKEGELRWYTNDGKKDIEVDGYGPHTINGEILYARSRTFIRARLSDNPYLAETNYESTLSALPSYMRAAYRDGRFDISLKDEERQLIPTAWILAAQARWKEHGEVPPEGIPLCAMAVDPAGNGVDKIEMVKRYDHYFSNIITIPKIDNQVQGANIAGDVIRERKDDCEVIVDMGGGYGSGTWLCLEGNINKDKLIAYKGDAKTMGRSKDKMLTFLNVRAKWHWSLMELLDPNQEGGSKIMLPDDRELLSDLAAPRFEVKNGVISIESKIDIKARIGRSPGKGDVVVMAISAGKKGLLPETRMEFYRNRPSQMKVIDKYAARRR